MKRRRRNPSMNTNLIMLVLVGGGLYWLYQYIKNNGVPNPLAPVGESIGSTVFDVLNPDAAGASVTYIAQTPDGSKIAVNNNAVDSEGNFTRNGQIYHLSTNASGARIAAPATSDDLLAYFPTG